MTSLVFKFERDAEQFLQAIADAILVPRIMGKVTGLNPAMILLSLSVWGKLLGLLGLIIALPMTYLLMVYYRRFLAKQTAAADPPANDGPALPGQTP